MHDPPIGRLASSIERPEELGLRNILQLIHRRMRASQTGMGRDSRDRIDDRSFSDDSYSSEEADAKNMLHRKITAKPGYESSPSSNSRHVPRERSGSSRRRAQTESNDSLHGRDRSSSSSKRKLVSTIVDSTVDNDKPGPKDRHSMDAIAIAKQRRAARKEDPLVPSRHRSDRLRGSLHGPSSQNRSAGGSDVPPTLPTRHNADHSPSIGGSSSCHARLTQGRSDSLGGSSHSKTSRINRSDPLSASVHSLKNTVGTSHSPRRTGRREDTMSGATRHGTRRSHPSTPVSSERLHNLTMLMGNGTDSPKPEQGSSLDEEDDQALGELLTSSEMTPKELRRILDSRRKAEEKKRLSLDTESSTQGEDEDLQKQPLSPDGAYTVFKSPMPPVSNTRVVGIQSARKERKNTLTEGRPPFSPTLTHERRSTSMVEVNQLTPPRVQLSEGFQRSMSLDAGNKDCEFKSTPKIRHLNNKYVGRKIEAKHAQDRQERRSSVKTSLFSMLDEQEDLFDFR